MKESVGQKKTLAEKIANALHKSLHDGDLSDELYLPSSRDLASQYGTSLVTMQKALHHLKDDKVIRLHSKRRGFVRVQDIANNNNHNKVKRIVVMMDGRSDIKGKINGSAKILFNDWGGHIISSMMHSLSFDSYNCMPFFYDGRNANTSELVEQIENNGQVDGVVFISTSNLKDFPGKLESHGIRWVSIKPVSGYTDNFVAPNNVETGLIAGKYFARMGFKRILSMRSFM